MRHLSFALAKGRLAGAALDMLIEIGVANKELKADIMNAKQNRKLTFIDDELGVRIFLAKSGDVPTYVEYGAADLGIVGKDALLEEKRNLYEIADLKFGKCKMVVAGVPEMKNRVAGTRLTADTRLEPHTQTPRLRVATKYPVIAQDYFYKKLQQTIEIIKLDGSVELGPVVGLADVIVDIVETGSTLRENGLVVLDEICEVSARLVINRVSMKMEHDRIMPIIKRIKNI